MSVSSSLVRADEFCPASIPQQIDRTTSSPRCALGSLSLRALCLGADVQDLFPQGASGPLASGEVGVFVTGAPRGTNTLVIAKESLGGVPRAQCALRRATQSHQLFTDTPFAGAAAHCRSCAQRKPGMLFCKTPKTSLFFAESQIPFVPLHPPSTTPHLKITSLPFSAFTHQILVVIARQCLQATCPSVHNTPFHKALFPLLA